jgi:hypothetical protein
MLPPGPGAGIARGEPCPGRRGAIPGRGDAREHLPLATREPRAGLFRAIRRGLHVGRAEARVRVALREPQLPVQRDGGLQPCQQRGPRE